MCCAWSAAIGAHLAPQVASLNAVTFATCYSGYRIQSRFLLIFFFFENRDGDGSNSLRTAHENVFDWGGTGDVSQRGVEGRYVCEWSPVKYDGIGTW